MSLPASHQFESAKPPWKKSVVFHGNPYTEPAGLDNCCEFVGNQHTLKRFSTQTLWVFFAQFAVPVAQVQHAYETVDHTTICVPTNKTQSSPGVQ